MSGTRRSFEDKRKVAFKALGGKMKGFYWHLGVAKALEVVGFRFVGGIRLNLRPRESGRDRIGTFIGSSAGAFFVTLLARGFSLSDIYSIRVTKRDLFLRQSFHPMEFVGRVRRNTEKRSGRSFRFDDLRVQDLLAFRALYSVQSLENFVRTRVLRDTNRFEELAAELYIMATELDQPRLAIFGERDSAQIGDHVYLSGVKISEAAAASGALPPVFLPYRIRLKDGREAFFMDGECRDTFSVPVAEDAGADLVFVSSVYQPYQFSSQQGSLYDQGVSGLYPQLIDQVIDSRQHLAVENKQRIRLMMEDIEGQLWGTVTEGEFGRLVKILERHLKFSRRMTPIYIYPEGDMQLYNIDAFDLTDKAKRIVVNKGYIQALKVLRRLGYIDEAARFPQRVI